MCDISTEEQLLEIAKNAAESGESLKFEYKKHIGFLIRHLNVFPQPYNTLETSRNTIFLFAISSLDLLGELDNLLTPERRQGYIDWIYNLQFTNGTLLYT
uniref:NR LBD domain-containing protein n=1 Tax=Caenorhabditis tropicalis TaxID=1561998 RepID=A0A1I7UUE4_9PELO